MANFELLENGDLINIDLVEYINTGGKKFSFETQMNSYEVDKTPEMTELVNRLSLNLKDGDRNV